MHILFYCWMEKTRWWWQLARHRRAYIPGVGDNKNIVFQSQFWLANRTANSPGAWPAKSVCWHLSDGWGCEFLCQALQKSGPSMQTLGRHFGSFYNAIYEQCEVVACLMGLRHSSLMTSTPRPSQTSHILPRQTWGWVASWFQILVVCNNTHNDGFQWGISGVWWLWNMCVPASVWFWHHGVYTRPFHDLMCLGACRLTSCWNFWMAIVEFDIVDFDCRLCWMWRASLHTDGLNVY